MRIKIKDIILRKWCGRWTKEPSEKVTYKNAATRRHTGRVQGLGSQVGERLPAERSGGQDTNLLELPIKLLHCS